MRKMIYGASAVAGVLLVVYLVMPAERAEGVHETFMRLTDSDAVGCLDYERQSLKDPDSARIISVASGSKSDEIKIRYKAKNGYGAYGTTEVFCARGLSSSGLDHDLAVTHTEIMRETLRLEQESAQLQHHITCLDKKNNLIRKGETLENARTGVETEDPWCAANWDR